MFSESKASLIAKSLQDVRESYDYWDQWFLSKNGDDPQEAELFDFVNNKVKINGEWHEGLTSFSFFVPKTTFTKNGVIINLSSMHVERINGTVSLGEMEEAIKLAKAEGPGFTDVTDKILFNANKNIVESLEGQDLRVSSVDREFVFFGEKIYPQKSRRIGDYTVDIFSGLVKSSGEFFPIISLEAYTIPKIQTSIGTVVVDDDVIELGILKPIRKEDFLRALEILEI